MYYINEQITVVTAKIEAKFGTTYHFNICVQHIKTSYKTNKSYIDILPVVTIDKLSRPTV